MRRAVRMTFLLLVIAAFALLGTNASFRAALSSRIAQLTAPTSSTASPASGRAEIVQNQPGPSFAAVAAAAKPAVVNVVAKQKIPLPPSLGFLPGDPEEFAEEGEDFPDSPTEPLPPETAPMIQREILSSGFAIDGEGTIVTSNHAVEHAERVTVRFGSDPRPHDARVLGTDPLTDLAVVKVVDAESTPSLSFAAPGTTQAGDWVIAIGNPFGLEQTLTAGIVSATDRSIGNPSAEDFLQVNASINPGDSGGPLLNVAGDVVGINTAVFREGGSSVGIAFALSGDAGRRLIEQLETNGRVIRSWLGVTVQDLNAELAKALEVEPTSGLVVSAVDPEGPAGEAGIRRGDVIVSYGPDEMRSARDLPRRVASTAVGAEVEIRVLRAGESQKLSATLAEMPERLYRGRVSRPLTVGGSVVQAGVHS